LSLDQIISALWRRKWLFVGTLVVCLAATVLVTYSLPKTYKATATLFVGATAPEDETLAFDTTLGEQFARTYTTLAGNPNVAQSVAQQLPYETTQEDLLDDMSFAPVENTQLLEISAESDTREKAQVTANTYARVFVERVDQQFERGETPAQISLNEPAVRPTGAAKPNPPLYLGLGGLLSVMLALAVVLLGERLDNRVRVDEDEGTALDRPILGRIPVIPARAAESRLDIKDAFRLLKANIDFSNERRADVLMVTSPSAAEGKSTVSAYLALTAAADGERVLLIEADLRRPGLAATPLGKSIEPLQVGLSNYLVGAADAADVIVRTSGPDVILAGPLPPNPSALLRLPRFDELIGDLRKEYDRVILDTSPVAVGADASVLVTRVEGVLYVIDTRRTKRSLALAGLNQLDKARAPLLGVVLNRAPAPSFDHYGYYAEAGNGALVSAGRPEQPASGGFRRSRR
jgi:polysaccharide biosynthesis transport protein